MLKCWILKTLERSGPVKVCNSIGLLNNKDSATFTGISQTVAASRKMATLTQSRC
jgi:hypothetical protein